MSQMPLAYKLAWERRWRKNNPELARARDKRKRVKYRVERAHLKYLWDQTHPEICRAHEALRRARKRNAAIGDFSAIARIYARARELRQWFDVVVDHIIPLAKGGAHAPGNLQIIYRLENLSKGTRLDFVPSVIFS